MEKPYTVFECDDLQKVVSIFRAFHLRHLCVVEKRNYKLKGIITREDLFAYMAI